MSKKRKIPKTGPNQSEYPLIDQTPETGFFSGPGFSNRKVEYVVIKGRAITEGDICLGTAKELEKSNDPEELSKKMTHEQIRQKEALSEQPLMAGRIVGEQYLWQNCTMPYEIDPNLSNPGRITSAMEHWKMKCGIKFVQRTTERDYVHFFDDGAYCWSYVGRQGERQDLSIANWGTIGTVIHEIGHALGLWHEQSRNDRDNYVRINWQNINTQAQNNFSQYLNLGQDLGTYDYCSIMHYGPKAFTINGLDTITALQPGAECMGQRNGLSQKDISGIKQMYPECALDPCAVYRNKALKCRLNYRRTHNLRYLWCFFQNALRYFKCRYRYTIDGRYLTLVKRYTTSYHRYRLFRGYSDPVISVEEGLSELESEEEFEPEFEEGLSELESEEEFEPEFEERFVRIKPTTKIDCLGYHLQAKKALCYYYKYLASYFCCRYKYTKNKYYYYLCRLYKRKYELCIRETS